MSTRRPRTLRRRGPTNDLAGIKTGGIVRVHDGLPYLAEVIGQHGARVRVAPITGPRGVRTVTSRDVVEHWRMARPRQPGGGPAGPSHGEDAKYRSLTEIDALQAVARLRRPATSTYF
jgi:hypothetical protein